MDILIENLIHKGVSTIPDEYKGVELEIGTSSKQKTFFFNILLKKE